MSRILAADDSTERKSVEIPVENRYPQKIWKVEKEKQMNYYLKFIVLLNKE